jgi:hypothetical protein
MKALVIKGKDRLWPKVTWEGTNLIPDHLETRPADDTDFRRTLRGMLPDFMEKFAN